MSTRDLVEYVRNGQLADAFTGFVRQVSKEEFLQVLSEYRLQLSVAELENLLTRYGRGVYLYIFYFSLCMRIH